MKGDKMNNNDMDTLIKKHYGFIIKSTSDVTGKYVSADSDHYLSIAMEAFQEAYERYEIGKGPFLPFAKLVIKSRLYNQLKKEKKDKETLSIDEMEEQGLFLGEDPELNNPLKEEIMEWARELQQFSISFEHLVENSPKHKDTRSRAVTISEDSSKEKEVTDFIYDKKRLPIRMVATNRNVSEKIIKGSKVFILSIILVFFKQYEQLILWIKR